MAGALFALPADPGHACDSANIPGPEFKAAMDAAMEYLGGAYICEPMIGDSDVWIAQKSVEVVLLSAGFSPDEAVIKGEELDQKARAGAKRYDATSIAGGNVRKEHIAKACRDKLVQSQRKYRLAQAHLNKAMCVN